MKTSLLYRLFNIGIIAEDSSLYKLRQRALNLYNFLNLVALIGFTLFMLRGAQSSIDLYQAKINMIAVGLVVVSIVFSTYRQLDLAVLITGILAVFAVSNLAYGNSYHTTKTSPEQGIIIAFVILSIKRMELRLLFITIYTMLTAYITYDLIGGTWKTIPIMGEDLIFVILFFLFAMYLDKIDLILCDTLAKLKKAKEKDSQLNRELQQRNEDLVTFTHVMTHDLKTPLRSINSFSKLILRRSKIDDPDLQEYLSIIQNNSKSMQSLIDDLLQYINIDKQTVAEKIVDLDMLIEEVIAGFQFDIIEKKVDIVKDTLPPVLGNPKLIKTVFHNLISNSIKYQPIDRADHIPTIRITKEIFEKHLLVCIEDNGIGIEQTYIPNLFEPFKRFHSSSEYSGSGLGMSICQRAMKKMHGHIRLRKSSHKGSEFELKFYVTDDGNN